MVFNPNGVMIAILLSVASLTGAIAGVTWLWTVALILLTVHAIYSIFF